MFPRSASLLVLASVIAGCGGGTTTKPEDAALLAVKDYIQMNLSELIAASSAIQAAAPAADDDGWNATADAQAVSDMKAAWKRARSAYEHVEGAIAVLFPELDISTDERYDGFVAEAADENLFDGQGVTGVHAIERILWSDSIPASVIHFEEGLPGNVYRAARFPQNRAEAEAFKNALCTRLVTEVTTMKDQFAPLALDPATAYRGVIGSMGEQVEKIEKAATGEEESRYAQYTLADMRANVEAGVATYNAFRPWLLAKDGAHQDEEINAAFARVQAAYAQLSGDALPAVPATWSAHPSEADLMTPFGKLYKAIAAEADNTKDGSLVFDMNESAGVMGIPQLPE